MTEPVFPPGPPAPRICGLCKHPITGPSLPVRADNGSTLHVHPLPCASYTVGSEHSAQATQPAPEKITDASPADCEHYFPLAEELGYDAESFPGTTGRGDCACGARPDAEIIGGPGQDRSAS